ACSISATGRCRMYRILKIAVLMSLAYPSSSIDDPERFSPPHVSRLEPAEARPGDFVAAYGRSLDRSKVEDVSLNAPDRFLLVHIVEQTEASIRFKVPAKALPGRYTLALHLVGRYLNIVEQPVMLIIE